VFGSPVPACSKTILGLHIQSCLKKERYTDRSFRHIFLQNSFPDQLPIVINHWQFENLGFDFPDEKVIELNQFMECLFEQHLCDYVAARLLPGVERKKLIEDFVKRHGIELKLDAEDEGDISLEALIKTEYRKRRQMEQFAQQRYMVRAQGKPSQNIFSAKLSGQKP